MPTCITILCQSGSNNDTITSDVIMATNVKLVRGDVVVEESTEGDNVGVVRFLMVSKYTELLFQSQFVKITICK